MFVMAPNQDTGKSFDDIIQKRRERNRKEELANKILGSGRRSNVSNLNDGRKPSGALPSLASRAGVNKNREPRTNAPQRSTSDPQLERKQRVFSEALNSGPKASRLQNQLNIRDAASNGSEGIRVRGRAKQETFTVIAQNFAPDTTASDIESAIVPDREATGLVSCRLITSNTTVIAELVFTKRESAEEIIRKYNNQRADGKLLHVYLQNRPPNFGVSNNPTPAPKTTHTVDVEAMDLENKGYEEPENQQKTSAFRYSPPRRPRGSQPIIQNGNYYAADSEPHNRYSFPGQQPQPQYFPSKSLNAYSSQSTVRKPATSFRRGLYSDAMLPRAQSYRPRGDSYPRRGRW